MIVKHVPMQSAHKSNFAELVNYMLDEQKKYERVGYVQATNCRTQNIDVAVLAIQNTQNQNTRAVSDKTYHLIVSFPCGERPEDATLQAIEARICEGLGFKEHQRVSVVHHDTDNLHFHIAINKIHPMRYTMHDPFNAYFTLGQLCEKLEIEYGLQPDNHAAQKVISENKAQDMECHAGIESLLGWIKRQCQPAMLSADSWEELHQIMQQHGLELKERGNGLIISDHNGLTVKASSVARDLSKAKLEAKLGSFTAANGQEPPAKHYQAKPIHWRTDTAELYARYQGDQQNLKTNSQKAIQQAQASKQTQVAAAKRANQLKRAAIKLMSNSKVEKKLLYHLSSQTLRGELDRINNQYRQEKNTLQHQHAPQQWADWLRRKATAGDREALESLRAREVAQGLKGNTVAGVGGQRLQAGVQANQDSITKKGTIIYKVGSSAIRDDGDKLNVSREATKEGLEKALQMAMERYGNRIVVNGDQDFKNNIVRVAVASKLPITFDDVKLERERQFLMMSSRKPKVPRIGTAPPIILRNQLESNMLQGMSNIPTLADLPMNTDIAVRGLQNREVLFSRIQQSDNTAQPGFIVKMHTVQPEQNGYTAPNLTMHVVSTLPESSQASTQSMEITRPAPERKPPQPESAKAVKRKKGRSR